MVLQAESYHLIFAHSWATYVATFVLLGLGRLLWARYGSGLSSIPGPFLASITNLWRFRVVSQSHMTWSNVELHEQYGNLVRLGPRLISASSIEAVNAIYTEGKGFKKSKVYGIFQPELEGTPLHNIFSTQDVQYHTSLKRVIGGAYAISAICEYEDGFDQMLELFISRLTDLSKAESPVVDMSAWLQYYTFDVQGQLNFSKPFGFLEHGADISHFCDFDHGLMLYFAKWSQMPTLEKLQRRLWSLVCKPDGNPLYDLVLSTIRARIEQPIETRDFLNTLLGVHAKDQIKLPMREVIAATYINVVTGHDVTAIQLRAFVYHVSKSPRIHTRLQTEIDQAIEAGKLSNPPRYAEAITLDYLSAVIQETLRIHPSAGLILERYVPAGGVVLHDKFIPEGTTIGVNAWAIHRNKAIFGEDVEIFRPERWLDSSPDRIRVMRRALFTFGTGSRSCIGKNIAMLQMYKLTVAFIRHFNFELADPDMPWHVIGGWLTRQTKMDMRLKVR